MNPYAVHAADLAALQAEAGGACPVMWYNGGAVAIFPGGASYNQKNSQGGQSLMFDLSLTVLASAFGPGFNADTLASQTFNYPGPGGDLFRVETVIKMAGGLQLRLLANSAAQGV